MEIKELISIIIPIYNAEIYLEECINSILKQTYQNFELILVDDGSTDKSWEIIDLYVKNFGKIKGIRKENGGANSARKKGLESAVGKFVMFVDADDYLDKTICDKLIRIIENENVDIVLSKLIKSLEGVNIGTVEEWHQGKYSGLYMAENIINLDVFFKKNIPLGLVANLYRKQVIQKAFDIVNEKIRFSEDYACFLLALLESDNVYVLDEYLYYYRQNKNSTVHTYGKSNFESEKCLYHNLIPELKKRKVSEKIYKQVEWIIILSILIGGYDTFKGKDYLFPFEKVKRGSKIIIYGAGSFGKALFEFVTRYKTYDIVLWVDKNYLIYQEEEGCPVFQIDKIMDVKYDYIVIGIVKADLANQVKKELEAKGIDSNKIECINQKLISYQELPHSFWENI